MSFDVQFSILSKRIGTLKVMMKLPILIVKFHQGDITGFDCQISLGRVDEFNRRV